MLAKRAGSSGTGGRSRWTYLLAPLRDEPVVGAGYRVLAFDREVSPGNSADLQFRGPISGGVA